MVVKAESLQIKIIWIEDEEEEEEKPQKNCVLWNKTGFVIDLNSKVPNYQHMNGRVNVVSIRTFQLEIYILEKKIKMKNK